MSAAAEIPHSGSNGNVIEKRAETAFFTFGRFQPPTIGHKHMIKQMVAAATEAGGDAYVFVSSTEDKKQNPLPVGRKVEILKLQTADLPVRIINTTKLECRTLPAILHKLLEAGYERLVLYVGEDRIEPFTTLVGRMFPAEQVAKIHIRSAGARVVAANNITGISGTKMRAAAVAGNLEKFKRGTALDDATASALMENIKRGLNTKKARRASRRATRRRRA